MIKHIRTQQEKKKPFSKNQRAGNVRLPRQDEFRNFFMSDETEKVYQKLEEIVCL